LANAGMTAMVNKPAMIISTFNILEVLTVSSPSSFVVG